MFQKLKLKSMLRNCDYKLAGTVLKQQYYDESKPTELNRLIDNLLQRPGFDAAVELIKYNELFVYYFTESCTGGLYVRQQTKSDAAANPSGGATETESASVGGSVGASDETAAAAETPDPQNSTSWSRSAAPAAADEVDEDTRVTYRRKQLEKLEHAWNELLDEQLQRISHKQKSSAQVSDGAAKAARMAEETGTRFASAEAFRDTVAEWGETRRESADDAPSAAGRLSVFREQFREDNAPAPSETKFSVSKEETFARLSGTTPLSGSAQAELPATAEVKSDGDELENTLHTEAETARFRRTEPEEPAPYGKSAADENKSGSDPDAAAAPSAQPEVFVETMPFRNPYASLFPDDSDELDTLPAEGRPTPEPKDVDAAFSTNRAPEATLDAGAAAEFAAEEADDEPEDADLAAIQPQFTKFPNVIATLKIDIREMRKQIEVFRRRIQEHPEEKEKYELWIAQLEEAVDEFMLSAAILSQYK